jgi:hypothetical protein
LVQNTPLTCLIYRGRKRSISESEVEKKDYQSSMIYVDAKWSTSVHFQREPEQNANFEENGKLEEAIGNNKEEFPSNTVRLFMENGRFSVNLRTPLSGNS